MVKLTPELVAQCAQYTNPVRDRELDLRGYKIPVIENLGATLDQFDTIDFSDNEIRKVDGFPLLKRLKCLLLNNNRIVRIGENLQESLPNLESLILANNSFQELGDLDVLATVKSLQVLSLQRNPVSTKKFYRLYVAHRLPQVRLLDFQKIRKKERDAASQMFKGKKGQQLARDLGKRQKTFVPGGAAATQKSAASDGAQAAAAAEGEDGEVKETTKAKADIEAIRMAITQAKTLDEIERLNALLQTGQLPAGPGEASQEKVNGRSGQYEEEDMDV